MSKIVVILLWIVAVIAAIYLIFRPAKAQPPPGEEAPLNSTSVQLAGGAQTATSVPAETGNPTALTTTARGIDAPIVDPAAFDLAHGVTSWEKQISAKEYNEALAGQNIIKVSYGYQPGMYGKVPQFMTDLYSFVQNVGWVRKGSGYYGV